MDPFGNLLLTCLNHLRVIDSEIKALVSLLSQEDQKTWLSRHREYCRQQGIDPVTGFDVDAVMRSRVSAQKRPFTAK